MSKTAPINMRVEPSKRALIDKAAKVVGVDRSAFIMEAACREAENALLNRRLFLLDDKEFEAFEALLDEPVNNERLNKLLAEPAPWEK